jgi:hypothetical protein
LTPKTDADWHTPDAVKTGYHMLIPMRKMVTYDWGEEEPRIRALQKRKAERQGVG